MIRDDQHYLAAVAEMQSLCERIETVEGAKDLADRARSAQVWAQRAQLGVEQVNIAGIAKIWAERRAGELLTSAPKHQGGRPPETGDRMAPVSTLADLGVSKKQSSRWQGLAAIPVGQFTEAVEEASAEGAVTTAKVARIADRKLAERVAEEFFPAPTPVFDAFWKACGLLIKKARADWAGNEEWDTETRRQVRQWAPLMVERIEALLALADDSTLHIIEGGASASQ